MEVKVTKCANGHYYDTNKYDTCPHCGAGEFSTTEAPKKRFGFLSRGPKATDKKPAESKPSSVSFTHEEPQKGQDLACEDVDTTGTFAPSTPCDLPAEDVQTQGVFSTPTQETVTSGAYLTEAPDAAEDNDVTTGFFAARGEVETPAPAPAPAPSAPAPPVDDEKTTGFFAPASAPAESLRQQVRAASDDNDVMTTGFFAPKTPTPAQESEMPQAAATQPAAPMQLPVGWLVCLSGKNVGTDYRLFAGKTSIGRTADNGICLAGETSVSRDKHAWVIFEPRKQEFFLKPGEESGLVYLNDENVFDTAPLHSGDLLELGAVKLLFIALCGPSFNWADYTNRG